jgi:uncharacterized membrane protein YdjX (TVP38/TMEM64 family)
MSLFYLYQAEAIKLIYSYKDYIKANFINSLAILVLAYTAGLILFLPSALFCITCGIMFGTYYNISVLAYLAAVIFWLIASGTAGLVPFNISRLCFKKSLRTYVIERSRKLRQFERIIERYGTKVLFLLRLSPLLPVTIFNYTIGGFNSKYILMLVSNKMYFVSSFGSFPADLFYVYLGYTAINFERFIDKKNEHSRFILIFRNG